MVFYIRDRLQSASMQETSRGKPTLNVAEMAALRQGVEEINTGLFFEAHETIEHAWTYCQSPFRPFLQAIIHVAVGCHHGRNGNRLGMERQLRKARRKLAAFLPCCGGIDTAALDASLAEMLEQCQEYATGGKPLALGLIVSATNPNSYSESTELTPPQAPEAPWDILKE